jgi:hypothetical protein
MTMIKANQNAASNQLLLLTYAAFTRKFGVNFFNVRFGSKADICSAKAHVRFIPESDIKCDICNVRQGPIADIVVIRDMRQLFQACSFAPRW